MDDIKKYVFFWGGVFSNFTSASFKDDSNIVYSSTEQYYQAKKALFFRDLYSYNKIMSTNNPKENKKIGQTVENFIEEKWYNDNGRNPAKDFMYQGNYYKFTQNENLKKILLDTGEGILVEASPYDTRWGIGLRSDCPGIQHKENWKGTNWLGYILTDIKKEIMKEDKRKNYLF